MAKKHPGGSSAPRKKDAVKRSEDAEAPVPDRSSGVDDQSARPLAISLPSATESCAGEVYVISRWLTEDWDLHMATVEAYYGTLGMFDHPPASKDEESAWKKMLSERDTYRPSLAFDHSIWWRGIEAKIQAKMRASSPEEFASDGWRKKFHDEISEAVKSGCAEPSWAIDLFKEMVPGHLRRLCENARNKLLTVGRYEDYLRRWMSSTFAQSLGNFLPVTNRLYSPRGIVIAFSALADRVSGCGRPQAPTSNVDADVAAAFLYQLIDWCDRQQAEIDRLPGLLGSYGPAARMEQLPPHADSDPTDSDPNWPPDAGWHFRPGEYAFQGKGPFPLTGTLWHLLKKLATPNRKFTILELKDASRGKDSPTGNKAMQTHLSHLRGILRRNLELPDNTFPIRADGRGSDAVYFIDLAYVRTCAEEEVAQKA